MLSSSLPASPGTPRRARSTLFIAIALQAAVLLVTVFVMVREEVSPEPPSFSGDRVVTASADNRRQLDRVRELNKRMAKPRSFQRLAVERSFARELPPLPALPQTDMNLESMEAAVLGEVHASAFGAGLANLDLGEAESTATFFGLEDQGRRVAIVVNTSASVVRKASRKGVSIERIQRETIELIEGLGGGTAFGILQFSQGTRSFSEYLAPALLKNKRQAADWVERELKGNPPVGTSTLFGHEAALAEALSWQPDLLFLVTDGSLNRRTPKSGGGYTYPRISFDELMSFIDREAMNSGAKPRLHIVGFELGETERSGLRRLAARFNGTLREF